MDELKNDSWDKLVHLVKMGLKSPDSPMGEQFCMPRDIPFDILTCVSKTPAVDSQASEVIDATLRHAKLPESLEFLCEIGVSASRYSPSSFLFGQVDMAENGVLEILSKMGFSFSRKGAAPLFSLFGNGRPQLMLAALRHGLVDVSKRDAYTGASILEKVVESVVEKEKSGRRYDGEEDRSCYMEVVKELIVRGVPATSGKTGKVSLASKVRRAGFDELASLMDAEVLRFRQGVKEGVKVRRKTV